MNRRPEKRYDVAIVGGGPAGLFAADYLRKKSHNRSVVLLEMGPEPGARRCPADHLGCKDCNVCTVISGLGGAGLHSDGKLVLDLTAGGYAHEFASITPKRARNLVQTIVSTLRRHDGSSEEGPDLTNRQEQVREQFGEVGLDIKLYPVLHMGTVNLTNIMTKFAASLRAPDPSSSTRLDVFSRTEVLSLLKTSGNEFILDTTRGQITAGQVVLAVGKSGAPRMRQFLSDLSVGDIVRPIWVGVRVDAPFEVGRDLFALSFDPKISMYDKMGRVKTHCFCRHGSLLMLKHRGAYLVGGHSPLTAKNGGVPRPPGDEDRFSFNVLASRIFDSERVQELFDEFGTVGRRSVVVQDLGSFLHPDRPLPDRIVHLEERIPARTADIRSILDSFSGVGTSIASLIERLAEIYPGIGASTNRVFAPAIEWDYGSVAVDRNMCTSVPGLYAVGDGAGLSQGIVHAGATGLICAQAISREFGRMAASLSAATSPTSDGDQDNAASSPT